MNLTDEEILEECITDNTHEWGGNCSQCGL